MLALSKTINGEYPVQTQTRTNISFRYKDELIVVPAGSTIWLYRKSLIASFGRYNFDVIESELTPWN